MKYKLTSETKLHLGRALYRIEAMIDFASVKAGDKGGFVEKEDNLSQSNNAWVYGNAWVSGNARVSGNAQVYGDAQVSGNAWVSGNAQVYGNAHVYGDARVSGNAWVYGNAQVYGDAQVYGNAWVSGNARVYGNAHVYGNAQVYGDAQVSPINIIGLGYSVTITDAHMRIGCEHHLITDWQSFDDRRIIAMDGARAAKFWKTHGPYLLDLCADRPGVKAETEKTGE